MTIQNRPARSVTTWIVMAVITACLLIGSASAAANPYAKGPDPTRASVDAAAGPFAYSSQSVSRGNGFGGGTLYFPTAATPGTFAAIAISPGFTLTSSSISWYGKVLASHGFVTLAMNTNSIFDEPDSRGTQLLAALDWMRNSSSVRTRIDGTRLGVIGHSMGGGGTLRAARTRPTLKGAIGLAPYDSDNTNWSTNTVPQLILGMQNDLIAPVSSHAIPFYNSLPTSIHKIYAEMRGASHSVPQSPNTTIRRYTVAFMKRELDNDTRYSQFLCPAPPVGSPNPLSRFNSTCNF